MSLKALGIKIISLAFFWCQSKGDNSFFKLTLILPYDVKELPEQVREESEEEEEAHMGEEINILNPMSGRDSTNEED